MPICRVRYKGSLPTIELSHKYELSLRRIALLQGKIFDCKSEIKGYEKEIEAHSVRIAEIMKEHEHGVLEITNDKFLIDFVKRITRKPDSRMLKEKYPTVYTDVLKASESWKLKVSVQPDIVQFKLTPYSHRKKKRNGRKAGEV